MDAQTVFICALIIAVGVATLLFPLLHYLVVGWKAKREDIMDGLSAGARLAYFKMFQRNNAGPDTPAAASTVFETVYDKWYGRKLYIAPALLLFLVGAMSVVIVAFTGLHHFAYLTTNPLFDFPNTGMAAIAGAYLWVVDDFISRARRLDFAPSDVMWGVLRLTVAVPMGYAFASIASKDLGPFVAFALGAFPLSALIAMLRRLASKNLNMEATADEARDEIVKLQGTNKDIVERLGNEDITTITQVAYCDPVRLVMRSNLSFNFVTDLMSQALAWMYLEGNLDKLRPLGMRGAVEIGQLIRDLERAAPMTPEQQADQAQAAAAFPLFAAAIQQDPATLRVVFDQIAEDPFTEFLANVWN